MMQSSNPVFRRAAGFNGRSTTQYGDAMYAGAGAASSDYATPGVISTSGRMTIDSVVQKTALTLGVIIVAAAATWVMTGDLRTADTAQLDKTLQTLYTLTIVGALVGFALSMVNSFKRVVSPALVIAYAAFEGVAIGALSKVFEAMYPGIVIQAVAGTFAAFIGTLAAYKFFNIQVSDRMRKITIAAMFGFVGMIFFDMLLGFFGASLGINGFGPVGLIFSVIGLAIGLFMLLLDFDMVERGVAAGLPERESWRAAFGLAVTLVWLYIEIMRILAILRR
jgi:uncharacterized YccA/Bax inhibitor family protein